MTSQNTQSLDEREAFEVLKSLTTTDMYPKLQPLIRIVEAALHPTATAAQGEPVATKWAMYFSGEPENPQLKPGFMANWCLYSDVLSVQRECDKANKSYAERDSATAGHKPYVARQVFIFANPLKPAGVVEAGTVGVSLYKPDGWTEAEEMQAGFALAALAHTPELAGFTFADNQWRHMCRVFSRADEMLDAQVEALAATSAKPADEAHCQIGKNCTCGSDYRTCSFYLGVTPPSGAAVKAEPMACQHRFMYFGDQAARRCADCNQPQPLTAEPGQTNEQGRAADVAVSDVQLMRVIVNACDSLHITRVHELGGKTRTIMEDAGLLEVARAVLKIQPAMPEMDLDLARAMCRSAGISLVSQEFIINFAEFYNDWRKGDFVLPKLAELDMEACFESWQKFDPDSVAPPALPDAGLDSQKGGV